ncbi:SRPBCC domain-containing protein [Serinicoccus kebangsaanensis]|uniref:SRPBCC domain-containing protein n=1 Tax=Serinicoccus kebangsaanensis TaxID=2602069 RepID=UPI00124E72FB|nr:SRPBCC domain-containing protein [Serinicoccus kebangsaanensis]
MEQGSTDRLGTVIRDGDRLALRYERSLAHPPETVWRALTESAGLRHWFPADIIGERASGAAVQLPFWPDGAQESLETMEEAGVDTSDMDLDEVLPGQIRIFDPPRRFELVWGNPEGEADVLRFELSPEGSGTRLVFTTWPGEPGPLGHSGTGAGWHLCLDGLGDFLDTGSSGEPDRQAAAALRAEYADALAGA